MGGETAADDDSDLDAPSHETADMFGSASREGFRKKTDRPDRAPDRTERPATPPGTHPQTGLTPRAASGLTPTWTQAADLDALIEPGRVLFDKFVVEKLLGQGGMGSVWLVRHRTLEFERALKLILPAYAADPVFRSRLFREARAMVKIVHPNAVAVYDANVAEGIAYIEMEYVKGVPLSSLLEPGEPMPLDWTARILQQLCDVLQAAHDQKIVHRDLKPSNLMLLEDTANGLERLKVLDFGIAKFLDSGDQETLTQTAFPVGTVAYASPEQLLGEPIDARSDLYSVGVILYELLVGSRPFTGVSASIIHAHLETPPPAFSSKKPPRTVPPAVEEVVRHCLAKKPEDRPQSARELAQAFEDAIAGCPVRERTIVRPPKPRPVERDEETSAGTSWRGRLLGLACMGLIAATMTYVANHDWSSVAKTTELTKTKKEKVQLPPVDDTWAPPLPAGFRVDGEPGVRGDPPLALICKQDDSRLVHLPGATFLMGHLPGAEPNAEDDDAPPHPVTVPHFYIQENEVTHAQMARYLEEVDPFRRSEEYVEWRKAMRTLLDVGLKEDEVARHPATGVSHKLASSYARWAKGMLPTEAEWEYAARSAGKERLYVWTGVTLPDKTLANIDTEGTVVAPDGVGIVPTSSVKSYTKDRTDQGVYDLTGNVREWCRDVWAPYGAKAPPRAPGQEPLYAVRGGAFDSPRTTFRTTTHTGREPADQVALDLGFRIVVEWP
jgi:serine/threonine-protein kinase